MDFYVLLGIERAATASDIKRAYKRLARKYHPDINPGDRLAASQFRQIAEAYETLIDPDRRRRYDVSGPSAPSMDAAGFGFEGFDFGHHWEPVGADVRRSLQRCSKSAPGNEPRLKRGADLHVSMTMNFEDAVRGGQRAITVTRHEHCAECGGTGRLETSERRCLYCQGAGTLKSARGHMVFSKPCPQCRGTGHQIETRCPSCGGQQTEVRTESIVINIPAGLGDGARIRVPGKGHAGPRGGEAGDLHIAVRAAASVFRREAMICICHSAGCS